VNKPEVFQSTDCDILNRNIKFIFVHSLHVTVDATSGGYKYTLGNVRQNFVGVTGSRTVSMTFDLRRPTHCKETTSCKSEPVDVGPDIDKHVRLHLTTYQHGFYYEHDVS